MTIKILLLFSSSELGGAERSLSRMAFTSNVVEYRLATLDGEGPWCVWVRAEGYKPLVFGHPDPRIKRSMLGAVWRAVNYSRKNSINIIYVCGIRAAFFLRLLRIFMPSTKLVHGVRWNPNSKSKLDIFFRIIERSTHRLVDAWITNSEIAKQTLIHRCKLPQEKLHVIHNGLLNCEVAQIPIQEKTKEILTVANLSPRKGYREYLSVVALVCAKIPEARFVFVGRDDMNGELQRLIELTGLADVISYVGFQQDVSPWYRRARMFVLPSLWNEGCPTSILEAMSFSVPCVAFKIDGIPELVESGKQGILVDVGNYSMLGDAIIKLLVDDSIVYEYGANGRDRVTTNFKISNMLERHTRVFESLMVQIKN